MSATQTKTLTVFAPAKVNLYLHVTGRLDNGYHTLDSLISFIDIGDEVTIESAPEFEFRADGPLGNLFSPKELDASPHSANLVVQSVWALARAAQKVPNIRVTLTKRLPLASGLGGGSSDAAAVIWGLMEWWDLPRQNHYLPGLMARLGADIPVCLPCRPARVRGIGDILDPVPALEEVPIVLVHPGKACGTQEVFTRFSGAFKNTQNLPESMSRFDGLIDFLKQQSNDLMPAAQDIVPEISNVLTALQAQKGCALARMSGSGATCFGLFRQEMLARKAAQTIARENPDWWVRSGWLNRPERY